MVLLALGYVGFEVNAVRQSKHLFEPLFTFDQFASMHHATRLCGDPLPVERRDFERNLDAVRIRAQRDLAETRPELPAEDVERAIAERDREREREVRALVDAGGCDDPEVRKLLLSYEQRSRLTIRTTR